MARASMFEAGPGLAQHPWINTPDTKYNPDGVFKDNLVLSKAEPSTMNLLALIDEHAEARFKAMITDDKGLSPAEKKKWSVYKPYRDEEDSETGDPTGNVIVFLKRNHIITLQGGEKKELHVSVYDSTGNVADPDNVPAIYGGTLHKALFSFRDVKVPGTKVAGVKLDLAAIKVLKLGGGRAGDPFTKDPDDASEGYVHQPKGTKRADDENTATRENNDTVEY